MSHDRAAQKKGLYDEKSLITYSARLVIYLSLLAVSSFSVFRLAFLLRFCRDLSQVTNFSARTPRFVSACASPRRRTILPIRAVLPQTTTIRVRRRRWPLHSTRTVPSFPPIPFSSVGLLSFLLWIPIVMFLPVTSSVHPSSSLGFYLSPPSLSILICFWWHMFLKGQDRLVHLVSTERHGHQLVHFLLKPNPD